MIRNQFGLILNVLSRTLIFLWCGDLQRWITEFVCRTFCNLKNNGKNRKVVKMIWLLRQTTEHIIRSFGLKNVQFHPWFHFNQLSLFLSHGITWRANKPLAAETMDKTAAMTPDMHWLLYSLWWCSCRWSDCISKIFFCLVFCQR